MGVGEGRRECGEAGNCGKVSVLQIGEAKGLLKKSCDRDPLDLYRFTTICL